MAVLAAEDPFKYLRPVIESSDGGDYTLAAMLTLGLNVVIGVGIAFAVIFIVIGGIRYITSSGDPKAVDSAKKTLTYSVFAFIFSSNWVFLSTRFWLIMSRRATNSVIWFCKDVISASVTLSLFSNSKICV